MGGRYIVAGEAYANRFTAMRVAQERDGYVIDTRDGRVTRDYRWQAIERAYASERRGVCACCGTYAALTGTVRTRDACADCVREDAHDPSWWDVCHAVRAGEGGMCAHCGEFEWFMSGQLAEVVDVHGNHRYAHVECMDASEVFA